MTSRKKNIPAKKAGAKPKGKSKAKKTAVVLKSRAQGIAQLAASTTAASAMSTATFSDSVDADVTEGAGLLRKARARLEAKGCAAFALPDGDLYLVYGTPASIRSLLATLEPQPVRYRDAITGLFVRAKEAFRRPKTTVREIR